MKQRIGVYDKKVVVAGDKNLVGPHEVHIDDLYSDDKNDILKKQRIGVYKSKVVVAGDINLVGPNEIHISKIGKSDDNSEKPEDTPSTPKEITFNAYVITSGGGLGGGMVEYENQTFTAIEGMTWGDYFSSGYGEYSPFYENENGLVVISCGDDWSGYSEYLISYNGEAVSISEKIIADAQYDIYGRL